MMTSLPILAVTVGEPAGIGPECAIKSAWLMREYSYPVLIGDVYFLTELARQIDTAIILNGVMHLSDITTQLTKEALTVLHVPLKSPVVPGELNPHNASSVIATLDAAIMGIKQGVLDAMVTAPIQKSVINEAGFVFSGHTEYLAQQSHTEKAVMMLYGMVNNGDDAQYPLRVALATTHLPLQAVPQAIRYTSLVQTIEILASDLTSKFGIAEPTILVAGLNPHAGENGLLGREEIDVIMPAIETCVAKKIDVRGPFAADTLFQPKYIHEADALLAMYHDQGLTVLKYATFGHGVNVTLGLPFIRTSADHGTALALAQAGVGRADVGSMLEAIKTACLMVKRQVS